MCREAIAVVEPGSGLPRGLLLAVALIETGRQASGPARTEPWPWSYNFNGESHFAATRADAQAEVSVLRARGDASVDVGCMQVNLHYHPTAFADLTHGFDPTENVRYAAAFLRQLHARTGNWAEAIGQYHSSEPARSIGYQRRVMLARVGSSLDRAGLAGLCAGRLKPVIVMRGNQPRMICRP